MSNQTNFTNFYCICIFWWGMILFYVVQLHWDGFQKYYRSSCMEVLCKNDTLWYLQNSQENTCAVVSFCQHRHFLINFTNISQNTSFFRENHWAIAFEIADQKINSFCTHILVYCNTFQNFAAVSENKRVNWCEID